MQQLTASRLVAVVLTFALANALPARGAFSSVIIGIALGHYVLGYAYGRDQLVASFGAVSSAIALLTLVAIGAASYYAGVSIIWPFALHHALNEVFLLDRFTTNARAFLIRLLRGAGFAFHIALYIVFVRASFTFWHHVNHLLVFLAVAGALYAGALFAARRLLSVRELVGHTLVEVVMLGVLALSFRAEINVLHVACYHFAQWAIFPATQMASRTRYRALVIYITATVVVTAACIAVSPLHLMPWVLSAATFHMLFNLFSHIHITTSFVLSRTNPLFVWRAADALRPKKVLHEA